MSRGGSARQRRTVRRQTERLVASGLDEARSEESTGVKDALLEDLTEVVTAPILAAAGAADEGEMLLNQEQQAELVEPFVAALTKSMSTPMPVIVRVPADEFNVDAALESLEQFAAAEELASDETADMDGCMDCGHAYEQHEGEGGTCSVGDCSCESYAEKKATNEASAELELAGNAPAATVSFSLQNMQFVDGAGNVMVYTPAAGTAALPAHPATSTGIAIAGGPTIVFETITEAPVPIAEAASSGGLHWVATLCPEGKATADGRIFAPGAITWRELPLSLMGMKKTAEGHDGAEVCGRIDRIWRDEATGEVMGAGEFDTGEYGAEIARLVADGTLRGLSVDIAVASMEILPRDEVVGANGEWIAGDRADVEPSEDADPMDILFGGEDMMFVVLEGIIGAATVCPFPAFAEAKIEVASSLVAAAKAPNVWTVTSQAGFRVTGTPPEALTASAAALEAVPATESPAEDSTAVEGLTASAAALAPLHPPASWFEDPELDELTPLTVTDDGQVFGHVAPWGVCHIGIPGVCTTAPQTETGYAYYMTKEIVCEDGFRITVGTVTMDTDHAGRDVGRQAAASHYDHTGVAAADIVIGEDDFGIWMAGAIRPDLAAEKVRALQGASVSGDWREVNGNLELVGVLAVNVPGFPIPRLRASLVASGDGMAVTSLIAAGVIGRPDTDSGTHLSRSDLDQFAALAAQASGEWEELAAIARDEAA